jgi:amidase
MTDPTSSAPSSSALIDATATDLSRRIRRREVSAVEVLEAHLRRIARWNPAVNAVVALDTTAAYRRAQAADAALARGNAWGPLHGVPVTVKDQFSTVGLRTSYGLPRRLHATPQADAPAVARLRHAGAIVVGKTNLPLMAYDWQSDHPTFGRGNNPWDLRRTPGGSSGGSAAALAARFAPLELGADVGGSIRLPAHFCGVYGLRPTEGVLPTRGITRPSGPRTVRHIVVVGPLARSVEDLDTAFHVLQQAEAPAAPLSHRRPAPGTLRVAVTPDLGDVASDADTRRTLDALASSLEAAGIAVRETTPPIDLDDALDTWALVQGYELTAGLPRPVRNTPLRELVWRGYVRREYGFLADRMARGARLDARGYFETLNRKEDLALQMDDFFADVDAWITPVAPMPAFRHCAAGTDLPVNGRDVPYAAPFAHHLCATALTGHPVVTLPAGFSSGGLPIGVQVHGRRGTDLDLLATAATLDAVHDVAMGRPL